MGPILAPPLLPLLHDPAQSIESRYCLNEMLRSSIARVGLPDELDTTSGEFSIEAIPTSHASSASLGETMNLARFGDGRPMDSRMQASTFDGARFQKAIDDGTGPVLTPNR